MIPANCRIKHDPPNTYSDCLRAAVASILEINPVEAVPHFFHDGCDGETGFARLREWSLTQGLIPLTLAIDARLPDSLIHLRALMATNNPGTHYLLFGKNKDDEEHVIVCVDDRMAHDPAWYSRDLRGPSNGHWVIMMFVPAVLGKAYT